ncbi:MAG: TonB-dependent receptor plug domain-containing protein, partial [Cyclobacteriaceae bacterium]
NQSFRVKGDEYDGMPFYSSFLPIAHSVFYHLNINAMRKFVVIISCWSCALSATSAQEDSLRTQYLDEVVVSASRSDQLIKDIPRSISVINQDQIESSIYNSVGELLSQQEGVYLVGSNQTPGTNQALFLRGANSNQVLVMIDGIRVSDPSSPNNAIDLSELSLTQVDHIEIIKGSHSTLYGSSAIGGVVNIITKKGGREGLHGAVSVLGGALGNNGSNFTQQADIQYKLSNGLYLAGSVFNQNVKGLNAALDTISNRFKPADKDDFEKTDGSIKVGFKNSSLDLFASYKSTFQQADIDAGAYGDDDNNYLNFYRNFWSYGGVYKINSKWNVKAIGSVSNLRRINENDSSLVSLTMYDNNYFKGTYYGDLFTHEGQVNYSGDKINAMLGGGSYTEQMHFDTYFYSSAFGGFESVTNYDSISTKTSTRYAFAQIK